MRLSLSAGRASGIALVWLMAVLDPHPVAASGPGPVSPEAGFQLFARLKTAITGNRVNCGLVAPAWVCTDSTGSFVRGGGFWPGNTLNQYVFNSGIQFAGIVDSSAPLSWAGQVEGAYFFNLRGSTNAAPLTDIWNSSNSTDVAQWPDAARVPLGDAAADLFAPALQGQVKASNQDLWFLSWEGDPSLLRGRYHTLGVLVETRVMSFTAAGNRDFFYLLYTLYNITCDGTVHPECYASARPAMRDTLIAVSHRFQLLNTAAFAPDVLPVNGYPVRALYFAYAADPDVTVEASGSNYNGVNIPTGMMYTYHESFAAEPSWQFDPGIYHPPFFASAGFVGTKFLRTPEVGGREAGLAVAASYTNGGTFSDPPDIRTQYRYMGGNNDASLGDDICNIGDVHLTHICYINQGTSADMRYSVSTGPLDLAPGQQATIALAFVFAPPLAVGGCNRPDCQQSIPPQTPTGSLLRFMAPDSIVLGVNTVDSMTGYAGYLGDLNADGIVQGSELRTVAGTLLGKAQAAQALFDSKFAQPEAPVAPSFYLIPGNAEVTVLWQASPTEAAGDPYFAIAQQSQTYDPNYRDKDVVGYRVYRGNSSAPAELRLLAQFNFQSGEPVTFVDHTGQVPAGRINHCDPEAGIFISCQSAGIVNGVPLIDPLSYDLTASPLIQAIDVTPLGDSAALVTAADTAIVGSPGKGACGSLTPCLPLSSDSIGVPYAYIDKTVSNHRTYYYAVVAFDLNSIRSGASSLESARTIKAVTPVAPPPGTQATSSLSFQPVGRGVVLPPGAAPTIDAITGEFSGPAQPADGAQAAFVGPFVSQLFQGENSVDYTLTGLTLGDGRLGTDARYTFHVVGPKDTLDVSFGLLPPVGFPDDATGSTGPLPLAPVDRHQATLYGVDPGLKAPIDFRTSLTRYQITNSQGRGCFDGNVAPPVFATCQFYGPRWFGGANESTPDPNAGNNPAGSTASNAGALTGVARIQWPSAFANYGNGFRQVDASLSAAIRAADFKFYWGTNGHVDSVIDVTHNVVVPFQANTLGGGWGIMTQAASNAAGSADGRPAVLTIADLGCVEPIRSDDGTRYGMATAMPCTAAAAFQLQQDAVAGPIAIGGSTGALDFTTSAVAANPGFVIYIAGEMFTIELAPGAAVPSNTVWTLRSYIGSIFKNNTSGAYTFRPGLRTFSALGATLRVTYTAENKYVRPPGDEGSIADVHTVPDPYYALTQVSMTGAPGFIRFVNLPPLCTIRIYTSNGTLVTVLQHNDPLSGSQDWSVQSRNGHRLASGVYFYSVEDSHSGKRRVGRMTIID
ncbi:MAG TPA: hypothetical protein VJN95_17815 [Gemmatimonadales bacterium]|nr:hypothetical protein [Gemmatimonadales bacterium]